GEEAHSGGPGGEDMRVELDFEIFGAGAAHIPIELNAVGDFGHQRLGKAHGPGAVVILEHDVVSVTASIRGVIVGAVVDIGPIQKLQMVVASHGVDVEEIGERHFAGAQLQTAHG